ncbi:MAG: type II toxin-antitoxin system VapC family toxin [Candidatus Bathyarchaeia archaeon]
MVGKISLDASIVVKWFKKGEAHERQALKVRDDIFTMKVHAIAPELLLLEVVRALVKIGYPNLIELAPMCGLLDKAKEVEVELSLSASDATYLAASIVHNADLLTEDKHLLGNHVLKYAEKDGIHILSLK